MVFLYSDKYRGMQQKCEEKDGNNDSQERRFVAFVIVAAGKSEKMQLSSGYGAPIKRN